MHQIDEYLDLVDENDSVIGRDKRSIIYERGLSNFRVVNCFLINSRGQIWIPRRASDKRMFPLCLDMSMGGHVESGESYEQAFTRELKEELNLDSDKINFHEIGKLTPREHSVSAFMKVYEINSDEIPDYNKNDFVEYFLLSPKEILQKLENGDRGKGDLSILIKYFYGNKI